MDNAVQIEPDWDLAEQLTSDYEIDIRGLYSNFWRNLYLE
jgi:hypothetical protein